MKWESSRGTEDGNTLLFSLQKTISMNNVTPGNSALQQENKSTLAVYHGQ